MVDFHDMMDVAYIPQYVIFFFFIIVFSLKSNTVFRQKNIVPYIILFILCVVSYLNGFFNGYEANLKPFVITLIFIFMNDRKLPMMLLERFIVIATIFLVLEYFIAYSQIITYSHLSRNGLIRPMGIFFGVHDISYVLVFGYFAMGFTKFSGILSIFMGSYQTALAWFFLVWKKLNIVVLLFFLVGFIFAAISIGHTNIDQRNSMVYVAIDAIQNAPVDYSCMLLGCSNDISNVFDTAGYFADFGYIRVLYQFGLIWLLVMFFLLRKYNKSAVFANIVLMVHYPVNLGVVGFMFCIWILKYIEQKDIHRKKIEIPKKSFLLSKDTYGIR